MTTAAAIERTLAELRARVYDADADAVALERLQLNEDRRHYGLAALLTVGGVVAGATSLLVFNRTESAATSGMMGTLLICAIVAALIGLRLVFSSPERANAGDLAWREVDYTELRKLQPELQSIAADWTAGAPKPSQLRRGDWVALKLADREIAAVRDQEAFTQKVKQQSMTETEA